MRCVDGVPGDASRCQAVIKMVVDSSHAGVLDDRDTVLGMTPLMHAAIHGAEVAVQALLDRVRKHVQALA